MADLTSNEIRATILRTVADKRFRINLVDNNEKNNFLKTIQRVQKTTGSNTHWTLGGLQRTTWNTIGLDGSTV